MMPPATIPKPSPAALRLGMDNQAGFVTIRRVPVLDVHSPISKKVYDPESVSEANPDGLVDRMLTCDREDLESAARNSNRLAASGRPAILQLGHSAFEDKPEAHHPAAIGFADNFLVAEFEGRPHLFVDLHYRREFRDAALTHPRLSVERSAWDDPEEHSIRAIALIRRRPERDLPHVPYQADAAPGPRVCYSKDLPAPSSGGPGGPLRHAYRFRVLPGRALLQERGPKRPDRAPIPIRYDSTGKRMREDGGGPAISYEGLEAIEAASNRRVLAGDPPPIYLADRRGRGDDQVMGYASSFKIETRDLVSGLATMDGDLNILSSRHGEVEGYPRYSVELEGSGEGRMISAVIMHKAGPEGSPSPVLYPGAPAPRASYARETPNPAEHVPSTSFADWCRLRGLPQGAASRLRYDAAANRAAFIEKAAEEQGRRAEQAEFVSFCTSRGISDAVAGRIRWLESRAGKA